VKSRDDAEDIVQEAFVRVYRFAPKFSRDNGTFKSWSLTILMNVARTKYQKKAKERGAFAQLTDEHYESLADPVDTHGDFLDKDEVAKAFAMVDDETAKILTLAYIDDLPYQQIADIEGTSVGAIKARVHRAKAAVRNALGGGRV
jgi:RNA polymerase sigma factor (sigma-70 family)